MAAASPGVRGAGVVNTEPFVPVELARFIDAQGHRVTAEVTRSGLLAVLTRTPDEGLNGGHPCLTAENAAELMGALARFVDGDSP
jgi:hypothetical protein